MKSLNRVVIFFLLSASILMSQTNPAPSSPAPAAAPPTSAQQSSVPQTPAKDLKINMKGSPFGIAAGFLYGYQGVKPYDFMPQVRQLGGDFTKIYLFWSGTR